MIKYFLRVEGVNLGTVIDDTDQLSVRRGGGLMILNAPAAIKALVGPEIRDRLSEIATGASIGLFEFSAKSHEEAETVRQAVAKALQDGHLSYVRTDRTAAELPLKHGTFVVDIVRLNALPDEQQSEQLVVARNRWRQLQESTFSLDGLWTGMNEPCSLDRTRTAVERRDLNVDDKDKAISRSVADRLDYGRGARQGFYERELTGLATEDPQFALTLSGLRFTDDLKSLAEAMKPGESCSTEIPTNLVDKLAIFYVDGNGFGKIGRDIFKGSGATGYAHWSCEIREHHRKLLKELIEFVSHDVTWKNGEEIRVETLLWGGDEILWVIPAWKGWEVARWFFSQSHQVDVEGEVYPLTYACGLVFCHAKAPIKNVCSLAKRLGDDAKTSRVGEHSLAYEVLESYDDISGDLETHRRRFSPKNVAVDQLVIEPNKLDSVWELLIRIARCSDFPMRQLYMLSRAWREQADTSSHEKRIRAACKANNIELDDILTALGGPQAWLHLLQMLPYLPCELDAPKGDQA